MQENEIKQETTETVAEAANTAEETPNKKEAER